MLRLAPTPSGFLHLGNACNFALNARWAALRGVPLRLRIDDLDRGRYRRRYVEDILRVIELLGIRVDVGPTSVDDFERNWSQELRLPRYHAALDTLRGHPAVYACPCSRKELQTSGHRPECLAREVPLDVPNVAWRVDVNLLTEGKTESRIPDAASGKDHVIEVASALDDFAIRRKNGRPSYQLACTVDDYDYGITAIGRGEDLLASTAAQVLLANLLGYPALVERAEMIHHSLIVNEAGEKISKSAGGGSRSTLRTEGLREVAFVVAEDWLGRVVK